MIRSILIYTTAAALMTSLIVTGAQAQEMHSSASAKPLIISPERPQDSRGETVYESQGESERNIPVVPGAVTPPQLLKEVKPKYPGCMRRIKASGVVTLRGVVSQSGDLIDRSVYKTEVPVGCEAEAEHSAEQAVKEYRFTPATLNGRPIAVLVALEVHYQVK